MFFPCYVSDSSAENCDSDGDPDYLPGTDSEEEVPASVFSFDEETLPGLAGDLSGARSPSDARNPSDEGPNEVGADGRASRVRVSVQAAGFYAVARTSNTLQRRVWDRKNVCLFCDKPQAKLSRHLMRVHKHEVDVQFALAHVKGSAGRRKALNALRKEGNYRHNIAIRAGQKSGPLIPCNRARSRKRADQYVACDTCKGFFGRTTLWRHKRTCGDHGGGRVLATAISAMPSTCANPKLQKVLDSMKADPITLLCKTDETILLFGGSLCEKLGSETKDIQNIRNRMRELGRLLDVLQKEGGARLKDFLEPGTFSQVVAGVRYVSGFDEATNKYETPSLALKLGHSLKGCAEQSLATDLENGRETTKLRQFLELYELQWGRQVSRHASETLREAKWNKNETMPVAEDIQILQNFLEEEMQRKTDELKKKPTAESYKNLAELVLTSLILFNRRRQGEASALKVQDYMVATTTNDGGQHPEIEEALSDFEKHLAQSLLRVVVRGKKGRGVPILFTKATRARVDLLLELRETVGVQSSPYIFINSTSGDGRPLRGCDALRKFAKVSGVKDPNALTSTKLRKHIATMSQVMNLKDNELDLLATFLGHDVRVHREVYRMPERTTQLAMVSKLLMAAEKGLGKWRGQSLADIDEMSTGNQCPNSAHPIDDPPPGSHQSNDTSVEPHPIDDPPPRSHRINDTSAERPQKRGWSVEEKDAIDRRFARFIRALKVPGKSDCIKVLNEEAALCQRTWKEVKNGVYTKIQKLKRAAH